VPARPLLGWARFTAVDLFVCALITALGALQFVLCQRASDFLYGDVAYVELAKSLLKGTYSFNFVTERLQPPGFPGILALVCSTIGCTHDTLVLTMPVFLTLGFLVSYAVICRQLGRPVAAASCLLLASSPHIFPFATTHLWPSFPYFFTSMLFLFFASKLAAPGKGLRGVLLGCLLCLLLTATVLIQSVGVVLIGGFLSWVVLSFFGDRSIAKSRLKFAAPVIFIAFLAQAFWMQRGGNPKEWPLPGYPDSYLAQLKVKSGNFPELGLASPKDVVFRVRNNLKERTSFLGEVLIRHWIRSSWSSPMVAGLIVLILLGVWRSLLRSDSQLCAMYFVGYECIYLLWPWSFDVPRFTIPVLPLACLYLAEGFTALHRWSQRYPQRVGCLFLPLSIVLGFFATAKGWRAEAGHGFQDKISAIFWIMSAVTCASLIWKRPLPSSDRLSWCQSFLSKRFSVASVSFSLVQLIGAVVVTSLVVTGVAAEIPIGRENLTSGSAKIESTPEIQAARWIQSHTDPSSIVASRHVELVYHFSRRKMIWFPPMTNPNVLMHGIREHHIQYVIVIDRGFNYYLPPDTICFDLLYRAYPQAFRLVEAKDQVTIYEVL
jgi:hypothetical protein